MFLQSLRTILGVTACAGAALTTAAAVPCNSSSSSAPTVTLANGTYSGLAIPSYDQDAFLGIPYAQPPLGPLRFRTPQSLNQSFDEPRYATNYSDICLNFGTDGNGYAQSEDCLTINLVRPSNVNLEEDGEGGLPVMVWIHGGGLWQGGSADHRYNLSFILEQSVLINKPIIAVSFNYRLGGFGFLASDEVLGAGQTNLGWRDQRLALEWIQENIGAFGGDKGKVTIWGESAGGWSVGSQLFAYGGRDDELFRAAIMESGAPMGLSYYGTDTYQPKYDALLERVNCSTAIDTLDCLRHVPSTELYDAFNITDWMESNWLPIVDGDYIPAVPSRLMSSGRFVKVPTIVGANTDEGTAFGPGNTEYQLNTSQQLEEYVLSDEVVHALQPLNSSYRLTPKTMEHLLSLYPDNQGPPYTYSNETAIISTFGHDGLQGNAIFGDELMVGPRRWLARDMSSAGVKNTYSYRFDTLPYTGPTPYGVTHFQEVALVFSNFQNNTNYIGPNPTYHEFANLMSRMWVSFANDLTPNNHGIAGVVQWPEYSVDGSTPMNIVLNATSGAYAEEDTFREEGIAYLRETALQWLK
ncbi:hypothetical protein YB2330_004943 [Saitoella coloradoensis]